MSASSRSPRKAVWAVVGVSLLFVGVVIYRSLHVAGYRCAVCMAFQGQEVCRTVDGPTEHEARMGATNNACAYLASGVTDSIACERTVPVKVDCAAID